MILYRSILSRILVNFLLAFVVLLAAMGALSGRFLAEREMQHLENELARAAQATFILTNQNKFELQKNIRQLGENTDIRLTVVAMNGHVLADSASDPEKMNNHAGRPEIARAMQGFRGVSQRRSGTLGLDMLYVAIPTDPIIRAARPVSEVTVLLSQIRRRILFACFLSLLLAVGLSSAMAKSLSKRIRAMEDFASMLTKGNYDESLSPGKNDELGSLEARLDRLRLELKSFVMRLSQDKKQLSSILNGLPEAVILLDQNGALVEANSSACSLFRFSKEAAKGQTLEKTLRHPEVLAQLDQARQGQIEEGEPLRVRWPDPLLELDFSLHKVKGMEGGNGILAVFRNVSHEARLERIRTDFIANMAHELRTPLTAIRGAAETLLDAGAATTDVAKRFLGTIHRHSIRLGNILTDISQLARLESGVTPVKAEPLDAVEILQNTADLFRIEAERARIALNIEAPKEGLAFNSDEEKIEAILVNLLQNSVRYTTAGGTVTLRAAKNHDDRIIFEVRDTGIGIPPQDIPRVTERFYRVDSGRSREAGGTGLGLSIVKHLVAALKGKLEIESEHGKGTIVRIVLPSLERADGKAT